MTRPLDGIRVLDFSWVIAGPFATRVLLDLGAEIIKVEQPGRGDFFRSGDDTGADIPFGYWNYGKESISVNLKHPKGVGICRELAKHADVVIENFRPGTLDRLGLGAEALQAADPRLIYCSISGFGTSSSLATRPLQAPIAHAMSGIMTLVGEPGDPPYQPSGSFADTNAGLHAAISIISALFQRERTGKGSRIDLSLLDSIIWMLGPVAEQISRGTKYGWDRRLGAHNKATVPAGAFQAPDGWLMIAGGIDDVAWKRLSTAIGRPDISDHNAAWRFQNQDEVYRVISDWVAAQPSVAAAEQYLQSQDVLCSKVNTAEDMVAFPYLYERNILQKVEHPLNGPMTVTNSPFHFDGDSTQWAGPGPGLGADNASVLGRVLGYSAEDVAALERDGVLYRGKLG